MKIKTKKITGKNDVTLEGYQHYKGKRVIRHEHRQKCYHGKEKMFRAVKNTNKQRRYITEVRKGGNEQHGKCTYIGKCNKLHKQTKGNQSFFLSAHPSSYSRRSNTSVFKLGVKHDSLDQRITETP